MLLKKLRVIAVEDIYIATACLSAILSSLYSKQFLLYEPIHYLSQIFLILLIISAFSFVLFGPKPIIKLVLLMGTGIFAGWAFSIREIHGMASYVIISIVIPLAITLIMGGVMYSEID